MCEKKIRRIDKSKKANIKCEHCAYWIEQAQACASTGEGKRYWNRCKMFCWWDKRPQVDSNDI